VCSRNENAGDPPITDETVDLVWDSGSSGTGFIRECAPVTVGGDPGWTPTDLLSLAAEADLLVCFLKIAAEGEILGYVSAAGSKTGETGATRIVIRPCIVIESKSRSDEVLEMIRRAFEESPVCRALRGSLDLDPSVVVETRTGET